jgi:hypothetical protein
MGEYRLSDTPSGHKTLAYIDSREVRLHSSYDPLKEAERSVDAFRKGRAGIIIVCGLGLGYHVRFLKARFPGCGIIICEKDAEVVRIARSACPEHLEGVALIDSRERVPAILEGIDMSSFRGFATYIHRPSYLLHREFYDDLVRDINRFASSKLSDLLTRFEFEEKWIENIFLNAPKLCTSQPVRNLFGRFRGFPGIIVSAGPSLRGNVDSLAALRDRALIVAVDTAFPVLRRRGIDPHIVMTLDAQKYSLKHFLCAGPTDAFLVADMVSYPRVSDRFPGRRIFSTTSKYYTAFDGTNRREATPMMDWIEKFMEPVGDVQSGGSVATSAFDLLLNLGCSPIVLVGQDLAYTGREIHCSGSYHNNEWLPRTSRFLNLDTINQRVIRRRKIKYVDAYGGTGRVISDYVFDLYKGWFEDSASKVPFPVINATGGGSRIRGTVERRLDDLALEFKPRGRAPERLLAESLTAQGLRCDGLREGLRRAIGDVGGILDLAGRWLSDPGGTGADTVLGTLDDEDRAGILAPMLRRSNAYIARHRDLDPEKASSILITDIASASRKLLKMLGTCLNSIETDPRAD